MILKLYNHFPLYSYTFVTIGVVHNDYPRLFRRLGLSQTVDMDASVKRNTEKTLHGFEVNYLWNKQVENWGTTESFDYNPRLVYMNRYPRRFTVSLLCCLVC